MPKLLYYIPKAKNSLPASFLFYQRKYYNTSEAVYPVGKDVPKSIDLWYEKPLFGKVDLAQRYVFPNPANLQMIRNGLYTINFVAAAYNDFVSYISKASTRLQTCMSSIVQYKEPRKAYENAPDIYFDYFTDLDQTFLNGYLSQTEKNNIIGFERYINHYTRFAQSNSNLPQTLAGYIASNRVSNRIGGLIIEFKNQFSYDNDEFKWKKYLSSDYFSDYMKIAANFGFYVNKNTPWSIVANMNSKKMQEYMKNFGISTATDNFYYNYYQAEYISYLSFKRYMFGSYSAFLIRYPRLEEYIIQNCVKRNTQTSSYRSRRVVHSRPMEFALAGEITFQRFETLYSDKYLLEKYMNMRFIESGIDTFLSRRTKEDIMQRVFHRLGRSGIYAATILLSELLIYYNKSNYKLLTSEFRSANISGNGIEHKTDKLVKNSMKSLDAWLKTIESEAREQKNKVLKDFYNPAKVTSTPITLDLGY